MLLASFFTACFLFLLPADALAQKLGGESCENRQECASRICLSEDECACVEGEVGCESSNEVCQMLPNLGYGRCEVTQVDTNANVCQCDVWVYGTPNLNGSLPVEQRPTYEIFQRRQATTQFPTEADLPSNYFLYDQNGNISLSVKDAFDPDNPEVWGTRADVEMLFSKGEYPFIWQVLNPDGIPLYNSVFANFLAESSNSFRIESLSDLESYAAGEEEFYINKSQCNQNLVVADIVKLDEDFVDEVVRSLSRDTEEPEGRYYPVILTNCKNVTIDFTQKSPKPPTEPIEQELSYPSTVGLRQVQGDLPFLIGRVIKTVMQVLGSIAFIIFIYGGVVWMTARGNAQRVERAINIILWAALGVVVILSSYALVDFVFEAFR